MPINTIASDPSESLDFVNIPEPYDQKAVFTYNFYIKNERVSDIPVEKDNESYLSQLSLNKLARYVTLTWKKPDLSSLALSNNSVVQSETLDKYSQKIISEDNFFNAGYVTHTFSNVSSIEQGASDLENYSRISNYDAESMMKMSRFQIKRMLDKQSSPLSNSQTLSKISSAYSKLADFPSDSLGLKVFNEKKEISDKDDLIRSISDSLTIGVRINNSVINDVFRDAAISRPLDLNSLKVSSENSVQGLSYTRETDGSVFITITDQVGENSIADDGIKILGYSIDKYIYKDGSFFKIGTYYKDGPDNNVFVDKNVRYGAVYFYSIKTIASVKMLMYRGGTGYVDKVEMWVASRASTAKIETIEMVPPPEPTDIKFQYDFLKRKLIVNWNMPINEQKDIKQFQVFRRKSIKHPFELIAQYGFDDSVIEVGDSKYKTGEEVDANDYENMRSDFKILVKQVYGSPVFSHVDEDFVVDSEFYESSEYIYAVCSIDAHGMISNYSAQYQVKFDSIKNRIVSSVVCDSGCPKQYPNLKLRIDTFKDAINVSGDISKKLSVYFTPEYLRLSDSRNQKFKVVEAQNRSNKNSYYLLQFINLDNQKMQQIKINIEDPNNITLV